MDVKATGTTRTHLIVGGVIRNEEAQVGVSQHSSNANQACSSSRNNAHIFPGVLRVLSLSVILIVQVRNGSSKRFDPGSGTIFTTVQGQRDGGRPSEAALNLVVDFGRTLAQIGPRIGTVLKAMLGGLLRTPGEMGR